MLQVVFTEANSGRHVSIELGLIMENLTKSAEGIRIIIFVGKDFRNFLQLTIL